MAETTLGRLIRTGQVPAKIGRPMAGGFPQVDPADEEFFNLQAALEDEEYALRRLERDIDDELAARREVRAVLGHGELVNAADLPIYAMEFPSQAQQVETQSKGVPLPGQLRVDP